jgi:imidazolonepropionase-like amidohydrolase
MFKHSSNISTALVALLLINLSRSCQFHGRNHLEFEAPLTAQNNHKSRTDRNSKPSPNQRIAIDNVRIFDGYKLLNPSTVVIEGAIIGKDANGATHIDGNGGVLLPGLIDSHCHPTNITHLEDLSRFGVTTGAVLACFSHQLCASLQNHSGLVDLKLSSAPAAAPGSAHGNITAMVDQTGSLLVANIGQAKAWVDRQVAPGPDYIKLIAEVPGMDQATLNTLTQESKHRHKLVLCHASSYEAYRQATLAQVDQIHHTPLDRVIDTAGAFEIRRQNQVSVPTLTMMQAVAKNNPLANFSAASASASVLHKAGVSILVGTDANMQPGAPATVPFGSSVHLEMELLVAAGLSTTEALRAATADPAKKLGLLDRGIIRPGMRADLLLIGGNPIVDIRATRDIKRVWLAGIEYTGTLGVY